MKDDYIIPSQAEMERRLENEPIEFENLEDGMYGYYESYSGAKYLRMFFNDYLGEELILKVYEYGRAETIEIRYANKDIHRFKHEYKILGRFELLPEEKMEE